MANTEDKRIEVSYEPKQKAVAFKVSVSSLVFLLALTPTQARRISEDLWACADAAEGGYLPED